MTITGTITDIEYYNARGHEKKTVTISPNDKERAYIEFRGGRMRLLENIKQGQTVEVDVTLEGKAAKTSAMKYNNLVAQSISVK